MDALSDVLRVMRLKGGVFLHAEFSHPWCLAVKIAPDSCTPYLGPSAHLVAYHFVLEGAMRVRMQDGAELQVEAGQSVLFPRNDPHLLGSDLDLAPADGDHVVQPPADGGLARIVLGGAGATTKVVCGFLGAEEVRGNPVVSALPAALRLDVRREIAAEWVRNTFRYAAEEIAAGRLGSEAVMAKLSELLLIEAIRRYAEALPEQETGWLAGLRDPFLSRALARLHADVAAPWTVDELAERSACRARRWQSDSRASWEWRRCNISPRGGSRLRRTSCSRAASRSPELRRKLATSRRLRSHERSSAHSACRQPRGAVTAPPRVSRREARVDVLHVPTATSDETRLNSLTLDDHAAAHRDAAFDERAHHCNYERQLVNPLFEKEREAAVLALVVLAVGRRVHGLVSSSSLLFRFRRLSALGNSLSERGSWDLTDSE